MTVPAAEARAAGRLARLRRFATPGWTIIAILSLMAAAPLFVPDYYASDVLARAGLFAILALALDLSWGRAGILSLGHSAFFGIGAYAMAIVLLRWDHGLAAPAGFLFALLLPALLAALVGLFIFYGRTSVLFVAVVTLSLPVLLSAIALRVPELTGGLTGLSSIPAPFYEPLAIHYSILAALALVLGLVYGLARSDFGRLQTAVRDNEERAWFLGYDTEWVQLLSFTLSAAIAGLAGGLFAPYSGFVGTDVVGLVLSTSAIVWVALGGRGTVAGALFGALAVNIAEPALNASFPGTWPLFLGLTFIAVILAFPTGLYGLFGRPEIGRPATRLTYDAAVRAAPRLKALEIRGLGVSFGALTVLKGVDLKIEAGRLHGLIGPNGAGKSTLINAVTGRLRPDLGVVLTDGTEIHRLPPHLIARRGILRTYQASNVFERLSVADNIALAVGTGSGSGLALPAHLEPLIDASGLSGMLAERAGALSHGARKWLELCMVLAARPAILLLDEPTAGLTAADRAEVGRVLVALVRDQGLGILIIEHDLDFVKTIAERLTVLSGGGLLADGPVASVLANPAVQEVYVGRPCSTAAERA